MTVVIPQEIVQFLERATVAIGGSRDRDLVPHVHRLSGWRVDGDRSTITCLIAEAFTPALLPSLEENGQFALTVCEVPSHETYQFKGDYVSSRPADARDLALCDRHRERAVECIRSIFEFPERALRAYVPAPTLAFAFAVREIFIQTPGPGAGRRLLPPEAEARRGET